MFLGFLLGTWDFQCLKFKYDAIWISELAVSILIWESWSFIWQTKKLCFLGISCSLHWRIHHLVRLEGEAEGGNWESFYAYRRVDIESIFLQQKRKKFNCFSQFSVVKQVHHHQKQFFWYLIVIWFTEKVIFWLAAVIGSTRMRWLLNDIRWILW